MDAECLLCARGAKWIARNDTPFDFRIIPAQSEIGSALLKHYGMEPSDPSSWLYIEDGLAFSSLEAVVRVGQRLGGIWHVLSILRLFPDAVQDYLYGVVARNRYRVFGKTDLCGLPDPEIKRRLMV